jgi:hypothetical protein
LDRPFPSIAELGVLQVTTLTADDKAVMSDWPETDLLNFFKPVLDLRYIKDTCYAAEKNRNTLVKNRSIDHATIVIFNLFRFAKKEVFIVTRKLNNDVYGRKVIVDQAVAFLKRGGLISVKPENYALASKSIFFEELRKVRKNGIKIINVKSDLTKTPDFIVVDSQAYRFESGPMIPGDEFSSHVQFENEEFSTALYSFFNEIK